MRYCDSILGELLKPISRRRFAAIVDRHDADAYDKSFNSWDHLVTLIFAQIGGVVGLRTLESLWNANEHHHYHLDVGILKRSTLSDANARRPIAVFAETFEMLSGLADRVLRREGGEMLRLIDATPIPIHELVTWAEWNGRTRGLKLHVVYDPAADQPRRIAITPATVNDVEVGQEVPIEAGATYIYDKAYCHYGWWTRLHEAAARFVTRQKKNARYRAIAWRPLRKRKTDGFTIVDDADVKLVSRSGVKLAIPMRRIRVRRDDGTKMTLITNDIERSAIEIASLYKMRWQIELLFRWIKQHLKIKKFLGRSQNAICLQLIAAMIAYLLLRIATRENDIKMPAIRFVELLATRLFTRTRIARIDRPPEISNSTKKQRSSPNQMEFCYA
jgi:putative transposase